MREIEMICDEKLNELDTVRECRNIKSFNFIERFTTFEWQLLITIINQNSILCVIKKKSNNNEVKK